VLPDEGGALRVVVARRAGYMLALLPLVLHRRFGLVRASFVGAKHANFHMPLLDPAFAASLDADAARALLCAVAASLPGLDAFAFINQPVTWDGQRNPVALVAAQPSPSNAYRLILDADCETALTRAMSAHARKNHRRKRARLAEFGACRTILATTDEERARILEAFLAQKTQRFAQQGLPDAFAGPGIRRFLAEGARPAGEAGEPALIFAAHLIDERIVATYIATRHRGRFSGMATSFENDADLQRYSPGEMLLVDLIRLHCAAGYADFDLGVGEAQYKASICNIVDEMVDAVVPVSAAGRLAGGLARAGRAARRWIKRSPGLHRLANHAQRLLAR
jgi:CelD/BcsL family acetyltransferase involved in cellulose biosynthesis